MKLFLLKRTDKAPGGQYDVANGFVVRAKNEREARDVILLSKYKVGDEGLPTWDNPEYSTCEEISNKGDPEIILMDFNAG